MSTLVHLTQETHAKDVSQVITNLSTSFAALNHTLSEKINLIETLFHSKVDTLQKEMSN